MLAGLSFGMQTISSHAETISGALVRAYLGNPELNRQRVATRAADESVAQAEAGYRPRVRAVANGGIQYSQGNQYGMPVKGVTLPQTEAFEVSENVFDGNRTTNGVRQAESGVMRSREQTRATEQSVLQRGATVYMDVLRDTAILGLDTNNVAILKEQLRQTLVRLDAGAVTPTDVAQAQSSLAMAQSDSYRSMANLQTSIASYRQIIGVEPHRLEAARPLDALLPTALATAITIALSDHPQIRAALHNVDSAQLQVQLNESRLYPTLDVVGGVQRAEKPPELLNSSLFNSSVVGRFDAQIYDGGQTYASIRRAKELLSQARFQVDIARDQVQANVSSTWGRLESAKAIIESSRAAVTASETALDEVRRQAEVGRRTTLDVLMAQQTLLQSRVRLVTAQRDRVVAGYALFAAIGRLSAANLALKVTDYDPTLHYDQVKDKWIGLRTPDGR